MSTSNRSQWIAMLAVTVFVSAFLLFQVQPLISKLILPWFGGSPAVWTTAMLFFQTVLFGGYAYAHYVIRYLSLRKHLRLHVVLLVLSSIMASMITPREFLKPNGDENPAIQILLLLLVCVGLPYFTLASTGPLVQAWFSRVYPGNSPYRLYSLSNIGSFLALFSFPYLFEPVFRLPQLGMLWTGTYWLFAILCGGTAIWLLRHIGELAHSKRELPHSHRSSELHPSLGQRLLWIGLPALASLTMIAVTDHVSHNIAPEPRIWIATLALYLLTFIITFDHERWYRRIFVASACLIMIVFLSCRYEILEALQWEFSVLQLRWSHFITMFLICFMCHGELVRQRPKATAYLTEFYMGISAGGACGGLFASLVAVNMFNDYYEWPLCLVLGAVISLWTILFSGLSSFQLAPKQTKLFQSLFGAVSIGLPIFWIGYWMDPFNWQPSVSTEYKTEELFAERNFYGTVSVDEKIHESDPKNNHRIFYSGSVTHGVQLTASELRKIPLSYYNRESGAGEAIEYAKSRQPSLKMAMVGLGTGSLAAYGRKEDVIDFYEINPEVIRVAKEYFTYINDCPSTTKIILGDGRLKMDLAAAGYYDIILLDAFTGGSVPIHLLTQEAFSMYQRHLAPNGLIIVHITNRHLNLYPIVKRQAVAMGLDYRSKFIKADLDRFHRRSQYFVMTNDTGYLQAHSNVYPPVKDDEEPIEGRPEPDIVDVPLWTDHFSSINAIERPDL